jgi:O-antigen/teichoic acid export membrane protein
MTSLLKISRKIPQITKLFSDEGLTRKAYLNALTSTLEYGARLLVAFVTIPIMVSGLGNYNYGLWQILNQAMGYISSTSGKPTQALKWSLANLQSSNDYASKRCVVGSTVAVWLIFFPILSLIGGFLAWFLPSWLKVPANYFWYVRISAGLLVFNLILINLAALPRSVLLGENLGYKRMGLSALLVIIGGGFTLVAIYTESGLIGLAVAGIVTTFLGGVLFFIVAKKYSPWFGVAKPSYEKARTFLQLSIWFMAWDLVFSIMIASDVVLLGLLNSVESVTSYALTKHAPNILISIIEIMVFGILPGLGAIIGSGDLKKASEVRSEIMALSWLALTFLGTTVLLWNQVFLRLWVGNDHYSGNISNLLVVIFLVQFALIQNDANIINLSLKIQSKVMIGSLSIILSLVIAAILVGQFNFGTVGLLIGFIIGRTILSIGYPILVGCFLNVSMSSQIKSSIRPIIIMSLLFIPATVMSDSLAQSFSQSGLFGWLLFGFSACISAIVFLIISFYTGLTASQRKRIINRLRAIANFS